MAPDRGQWRRHGQLVLATARWLAARRRWLPAPRTLLTAAVAVSFMLLVSGLWHTRVGATAHDSYLVHNHISGFPA